MSPAQEVSMAMDDGHSSRETVGQPLDMQVRRTAENTLPGLTILGLPESDPPIVSTDPHIGAFPYRHSMTSPSLPIVTRSSTTQPDLPAHEHPITSLTRASLREVSENTESTEPARSSSSHLLQSDSPRASHFLAIHADNETDLHVAGPSCSSFSRAFSETPHIPSPPQTSTHVHLSVSPSSPTSVTSGQRSTLPSPARPSLGRKPCIVEGCTELVAPSMWRNHMNAHAKSLFPGSVPTGWLEENGLFICNKCSQLVAKSHSNSHQQKCVNRGHSMGSVDLSSNPGPTPLTNSVPIPTLDRFSFEDVSKLKCATIRHIPAKAMPIFAKVLSAALREVLNKNTEEAWLNFLMLPKCVLLPSRRKGRHHKNS